jgi:hypothetical protein
MTSSMESGIESVTFSRNFRAGYRLVLLLWMNWKPWVIWCHCKEIASCAWVVIDVVGLIWPQQFYTSAFWPFDNAELRLSAWCLLPGSCIPVLDVRCQGR